MYAQFNTVNFRDLCDRVSSKDGDLKKILLQYGYPPLWSRKPGFKTLIHIILEQQVSLASAKAALDKLQSLTGRVTPAKIRSLSDVELKACYFSRQKIVYARHLAEALVSRQLRLNDLEKEADEMVIESLKNIKGIGDWTADIYLMMVLHRTDRFPLGDIALVKSIRTIKGLTKEVTKEEIYKLTLSWKPYRTIAAFILWHGYLSKMCKCANVRMIRGPLLTKEMVPLLPEEGAL